MTEEAKVTPEKTEITDIDSLDEETILNLPPDKLDEYLNGDSAATAITDHQDEPTNNEDEPEKPAAEDESITGKPTDEPEAPTDETGSELTGKDEDVTHDPLLDTKRAFHKEREKNVTLMREKAALEKQVLEINKPKKPDDLDDEEMFDLKQEDRLEYDRIMDERSRYNEDVSEYDEKVDQADQEVDRINQELANQSTVDGINDAIGSLLKIDVNGDLAFDKQPEAFQEMMQSDEFNATLAEIDKYPKHYYEEDGSISAKTIRQVHLDLHQEKMIADARVKGSENTLASINGAKGKGSTLGKVAASKKGGDRKQVKDLTDAEIAQLPEDKLNSYFEELEAQGL